MTCPGGRVDAYEGVSEERLACALT
ncbi:hypothetical protein AVEN_168922-1, partial [Araneus ventricosus]